MRNYDLGILTFWDVPNYGTFAQAYALQKTLQKMNPERDIRQIAYLDQEHYRFYYSRIPVCKPCTKRFFCELVNRNSISANKRRKMFLEAYQDIPHTDRFDKEGLQNAMFNTVYVGSDIIWDYSFKCFNNDKFLFGNGFKTKKVNAYAASFGTIRREQQYPEYVVTGIQSMNRISVRDENSKKIVEEITGKSPEIVLDPTWLWDFKSDENVVNPKIKDYMIVYGQDFTKSFIIQIVEYAKKHNLKLVCLDCNNDNYSWCDVILRQSDLTPYEWIGLFREAQIIATTTFHGLTFALIFNKRFAFCKTDFILSKAGTFLEELGLYEKFNDSSISVKEMLDEAWNYDVINKIIDKKKTASIQFLADSLK